MRRTLVLVALVAVGTALVLAVGVPRRAPEPGARGHRVFRLSSAALESLELRMAERMLTARPTANGWDVDGEPAPRTVAAALDDLRAALVHLRAVDVFRPRDVASYGLDRPRMTLVVRTPRAVRRVTLGAANAAGSAFYARRDDDPRVMQVGSLLVGGVERVFFERARAAQRPEMG
jgi:hypothetical protein